METKYILSPYMHDRREGSVGRKTVKFLCRMLILTGYCILCRKLIAVGGDFITKGFPSLNDAVLYGMAFFTATVIFFLLAVWVVAVLDIRN